MPSTVASCQLLVDCCQGVGPSTGHAHAHSSAELSWAHAVPLLMLLLPSVLALCLQQRKRKSNLEQFLGICIVHKHSRNNRSPSPPKSCNTFFNIAQSSERGVGVGTRSTHVAWLTNCEHFNGFENGSILRVICGCFNCFCWPWQIARTLSVSCSGSCRQGLALATLARLIGTSDGCSAQNWSSHSKR